MRRFLFTTIMLILALISNAQVSSHVHFGNMSISGNLDTFLSNLKAKGFIVDSVCDNEGKVFLHGNLFSDKFKDQQIVLFYTEKTKTIKCLLYVSPISSKKQILKLWKKYEGDYKKKSESSKIRSSSDDAYEVSYYSKGGDYLGSLDANLLQSNDSASFFLSFVDWNGVIKGRNEFAEKYLYPVANDDDHLNFMGINLNDSLYGVCRKLIKKGFEPNNLYGKLRGLHMENLIKKHWGLSQDDTLHVDINRLDNSQIVYSLQLLLPFQSNTDLDNALDIYRELFDKKYGVAQLSKGKYSYKVVNTSGKVVGGITLSKTKYNDLSILYLDLINSSLHYTELQEQVRKSEQELAEAKEKEIQNIANDGRFHFQVKSDGSFNTIDGRPYYVINFSHQTAHQIYTTLATNVSRLYVNPSEVMSGVKDKTLVINGMASNFYKADLPDDISLKYSMLYRIEILIKDGRIRVNPPSVTSFPIEWVGKGTGTLDYDSKSPSECLALFSGDQEFAGIINNIINNAIYCIVYGVSSSADDDW